MKTSSETISAALLKVNCPLEQGFSKISGSERPYATGN